MGIRREWAYLRGPKSELQPDIIQSKEEAVLDLIKELDVSGVCIDAGAWIGYYTLLLAKKAKMVIAVEPDPRNIRYLRHNIKVNKVNNVKIVPFALDGKDGYGRIVIAPNTSGNSLYACGYTRSVKTITLRTLLEDIEEPKVELIKMDIERAEFPVLRNLEPGLFDRVNKWIVECHIKENEAQTEIQGIFEANGYHVQWFKDTNKGRTDHIYAVK